MDLATLIKLQEEAKQQKQKATQETTDSIKAIENQLFERYRKTKRISSFEDIQKLNSKEAVQARLSNLKTDGVEKIDSTLERIIGGDKGAFLPIEYLRKALAVSQTVARIVQTRTSGMKPAPCGTGSLVGPALFITNNHVISHKEAALNCFAEFEYEAPDINQKVTNYYTFAFRPDLFFLTNPALDYTILAINYRSEDGQKLISTYGTNKLGNSKINAIVGERVNIIQHPLGEPKLIAFRENKVIDMDDKYLIYETDTERGSSGSLVLNDQWEAVALHCAGVPMRVNGKQQWVANKGVLMSQILADVDKECQKLDKTQKKLAEELLWGYREYKARVGEYKIPGSSDLTSKTIEEEDSVDTVEIRQENTSLLFDIVSETSFEEIKTSIEHIFPEAKVSPFIDSLGKEDTRTKQTFSFLSHLYKVELESTSNIWEIAQQLEKLDGIIEVDPLLSSRGFDKIQKDHRALDMQESSQQESNNKVRLEKKFPGLHPTWHHDKVKFPQALQYASENGLFDGQTDIKIAQIDTGYTQHPKIWNMNKREGYDYMEDDNIAHDDNDQTFLLKQPGHGTRTASVLIGSPTHLSDDYNNGLFAHLNYVPFRVSDSVIILRPKVAERAANVVLRAIREEFDIIVMSMGGLGKSVWRLAAREAYENGIIWVCAAGNVARLPNFVTWPAAYPGTIATSATNYKDAPWRLAMRGPEVDVSAPGENIYVPKFDEQDQPTFSYGSGTSYAVPHIAAAAALWLHAREKGIVKKYGDKPKDKWKKVEGFRQLLHRTARKPANWDTEKMGAGILDVEALINTDLPNITDQDHVYGKKSSKQYLESYKSQKYQLEQKELLHHLWNGNISSSLERIDGAFDILSPKAQDYIDRESEQFKRLEKISDKIFLQELPSMVKKWDR